MKEDLPEGSNLLKMEVTDLDTESYLMFYITEGDPGLQFAMDDRSPGTMYLRRGLDRETKDRYKLTVVASDSKYITTAQVVIHVLDVNGEPQYTHFFIVFVYWYYGTY